MAAMGALPARFRRQRVLVVGCGDVGVRAAQRLVPRVRVLALTSSVHRVAELRALGITPLLGNLDDDASLRRLAGVAHRVLHLAPPPTVHGAQWQTDPRTRALVRVLLRRTLPRSLVYGSTSGVYGDCAGDWVAETRAVNPQTPRAVRRVDAETSVKRYGQLTGVPVAVLRIPGIYAPDREGGTPRGRLLRGTPVLRPEEDVYTNHIHANDLARACALALWRAAPFRTLNVCDDTVLTMGGYFDLAADLYGLPRPARVSRQEAQSQLPVALLSFMGESRRLVNDRMKAELGLVLQYPTVRHGLL